MSVFTTLFIESCCVSWMKLFSDDNGTHALEVTQASLRAAHMGSPTHGTASKRRRIELGWEVLRDHLQPQRSDFDVIPWYENHNTMNIRTFFLKINELVLSTAAIKMALLILFYSGKP